MISFRCASPFAFVRYETEFPHLSNVSSVYVRIIEVSGGPTYFCTRSKWSNNGKIKCRCLTRQTRNNQRTIFAFDPFQLNRLTQPTHIFADVAAVVVVVVNINSYRYNHNQHHCFSFCFTYKNILLSFFGASLSPLPLSFSISLSLLTLSINIYIYSAEQNCTTLSRGPELKKKKRDKTQRQAQRSVEDKWTRAHWKLNYNFVSSFLQKKRKKLNFLFWNDDFVGKSDARWRYCVQRCAPHSVPHRCSRKCVRS